MKKEKPINILWLEFVFLFLIGWIELINYDLLCIGNSDRGSV